MSAALEELFDELRLSYNQLVQVAEGLHRDEPVTLGMRAVLELLTKNGAATVPEIAKSRAVSRQHIQTLVNSLIDDGLVSLAENPGHKRSSLVTLTSRGERTIQRMKQREQRMLDAASRKLKQSDIRAASKTLATVREALVEQVQER